MRLPSFGAFCVFVLVVAVPAMPTFAHPGGLNAEGSHNNRKTGGYHCHRGQSSSPSNALQAVIEWSSRSPPGRCERQMS